MEGDKFITTLLELSAGGDRLVLWLLIVLSIWATAIILERLLYYRQIGPRIRGTVDEARQALAGNGSAGGGGAGEGKAPSTDWRPSHDGPVARLLTDLWTEPQPEDVEASRIEHAIGELHRRLMRRTSVLGTLGANAPFIGLLGTVFGIIQAFRDLAAAGKAEGAQSVMAGIAEALVATGLGLLVAIPCVVAFNYFSRRASLWQDEITEVAHWLAAERRHR